MPEANGLVKSVEDLIAEKAAVAAKEKKLIEDLNTALGKMGYRVVSTKPAAQNGVTGRKPGRPPGTGKTVTSKGAQQPNA